MPFQARVLRVQLPGALPKVVAGFGQNAVYICRPTCKRGTCGNQYTGKQFFIQIGEDEFPPVGADDLRRLRERLETQLREVEVAEEALKRREQEQA